MGTYYSLDVVADSGSVPSLETSWSLCVEMELDWEGSWAPALCPLEKLKKPLRDGLRDPDADCGRGKEGDSNGRGGG